MFTKNGNILKINGDWLKPSCSPGPIPSLPPNTVRVRTIDGKVPNKVSVTSYETATLVSGTTDVYDVYKSGTDFSNLLYNSSNVIEVLEANTIGITNMEYMLVACQMRSVPLFDTSKVTNMEFMFNNCTKLRSVPLFDTSKVTNMSYMFNDCSGLRSVPLFDTSNVTDMRFMFDYCSNLTSIPLFDTSNVTNMKYMFYYCDKLTSIPLFNTSKVTNMASTFYRCYKVESGALALYKQASSQANPPTTHYDTFDNCGIDTSTGLAELEQIPSDWK